MNLEDIISEYEANGRLSRRATERLRELTLGCDAYSAITVAADCGAFAVSPEIASALNANDEMVRWNAVAALFTRFRNFEYGHICLQLAKEDPSMMVRSMALCGLGEILFDVNNPRLRKDMASLLLETFNNKDEEQSLREAAYEGILAAMDVLPLDRPSLAARLEFPRDADQQIIFKFTEQYIVK